MSLDIYNRFVQTARSLNIGIPLAGQDQAPLQPGGAPDFEALLKVNPRPLIHPDAGLVVIFSPKSACTNVVVWFLDQLGHTKAARSYSSWPHEYRQRVYYESALYQKACGLDLTKFKVIRVIRDPYDRATSSFRYAVRSQRAHGEIAKELGYAETAAKGLSFDQYLMFLERLDLTACNPHFRLQRHPIEDVLPVHHLINISTQDLFKRLTEIETELGLPPASAAMTDWVNRLRTHNRPQQPFADMASLQTLPLTLEQAKHGPWPASGAFLTTQARQRIAKLYAVDIRSYLSPAGGSSHNSLDSHP